MGSIGLLCNYNGNNVDDELESTLMHIKHLTKSYQVISHIYSVNLFTLFIYKISAKYSQDISAKFEVNLVLQDYTISKFMSFLDSDKLF